MKKILIFLILIATFRGTLFWLLVFIVGLCSFIKSNGKTDISEKNRYLKLDKWICLILMFCGVIGIIRSFDILKPIASIVLLILVIIGLILQILYLKMKGKENHE